MIKKELDGKEENGDSDAHVEVGSSSDRNSSDTIAGSNGDDGIIAANTISKSIDNSVNSSIGSNSTPSVNQKDPYLSSLFKLFIALGFGLVFISIYGYYDNNQFHFRTSLSSSSPPPPPPVETFRRILDLTYLPGAPVEEKNRTQIGVENATLFMLVRNFEVQDALDSIRQVEDRFNKNYRYPWVFLNDVDFSEEFIRLTSGLVSGEAHYGKVPYDHWSIPKHINETLMKQKMEAMEANNIIYGGSTSYRNMCRFNSGFFFRHRLMQKYDWYWRVEPGVKYYCDQLYDPFTFLKNNNKMYGFVITIYEYIETIPTLWNVSKSFLDSHSEYIAPDNALNFITDNTRLRPDDIVMNTNGSDYNLCHFWSNFEIANLNFFRSQAYLDYFDHLDKTGGFFYERWGDAPVHTIALAAMLNRRQIHHFSDIGYKHSPYFRCPHDEASYTSGRCVCNEFRGDIADLQPFSCLTKWWYHAGKQFMFNFTDVKMS